MVDIGLCELFSCMFYLVFCFDMIDLNEMVILMFVYCLYKFISEYVDYY